MLMHNIIHVVSKKLMCLNIYIYGIKMRFVVRGEEAASAGNPLHTDECFPQLLISKILI